MLNLDTHILIRALHGELRTDEQVLLERNRWTISAIVFWELTKLSDLRRIDPDLEDREVVRTLSGLQVWPTDPEVARVSRRLDFRGDPADKLITATSVVHDVPLVTRDRVIQRSKLVPIATVL